MIPLTGHGDHLRQRRDHFKVIYGLAAAVWSAVKGSDFMRRLSRYIYIYRFEVKSSKTKGRK